jgi:hypothetical protein
MEKNLMWESRGSKAVVVFVDVVFVGEYHSFQVSGITVCCVRADSPTDGR